MNIRNLMRITALVVGLVFPASAFAAVSPETISHVLLGTWQNTEDTAFTREFAADGSTTDRHEGDRDATVKGSWLVFRGDAPPPEAKDRKLRNDAIFLEIKQNGDVLIFGLMALTVQSLQVVYLERGNVLSFTRIK